MAGASPEKERDLAAEAQAARFDFRTAAAALRAGEAFDEWFARWLPMTYAAPEAFDRALYAFAALRRGGLKSSRGTAFDFYYDIVVAHLGAARRALVTHSSRGFEPLSFDALHARSGALYGAWRQLGVEPGDVICIGLPLGVDYAVALVTALRLGAVVCPAPALGTAFLRQRLIDSAADFAVVGERDQALLEGLALEPLPHVGERDLGSADAYSYRPDEVVLRCFSPYGREPLAPVEVPAALLHASLLRDATLVLALEPGDTVAAPGWDPLVCQPSLVLATWFAGASYAELDPVRVARQPELLAACQVNWLGVRAELRDAFAELAAWPAPSVRGWFRCLTDALVMAPWDRFGKLASASGVFGFNTAFAQSAGGALLRGPTLTGEPSLRAWPAPGRPWLLTEVLGGTLESLRDTGVYTPFHESKALDGVPRLILSRGERAYECSGALDLGPDARTYPIDEVSRVAQRHPALTYASVVVSSRGINAANVTLLAFCEDPNAVDRADLVRWLEREVGRTYLPTRIEVFALMPRLSKQGVDHGWCRSQYLSGALTKKASDPLFTMMSRLGYLMSAPAALEGGG